MHGTGMEWGMTKDSTWGERQGSQPPREAQMDSGRPMQWWCQSIKCGIWVAGAILHILILRYLYESQEVMSSKQLSDKLRDEGDRYKTVQVCWPHILAEHCGLSTCQLPTSSHLLVISVKVLAGRHGSIFSWSLFLFLSVSIPGSASHHTPPHTHTPSRHSVYLCLIFFPS